MVKHIECAFVGEGQALYDSIAHIPIEWIDVANRLQSRFLFKESLIHLVGRYNELSKTPLDEDNKERDGRSVLDGLLPDIRAVVERKAEELRQICQTVEQNITSYYPPQLHRQSVTGRADTDDIGRKSYANDIMCWMALSLFRHWFGQQMALVRYRPLVLNGYIRPYTDIASRTGTITRSLEALPFTRRLQPVDRHTWIASP